MGIQATHYAIARKYRMDGTVVLGVDSLKMALVSSAYTLDAANHDEWADVSAHEISGSAYTAGGQTLTGISVTYDSNYGYLHADNIVWTGDALTARYAILYRPGSINGKNDPLIAAFLLDDTPADFTSSNFTILVDDTNGILRLQ